MTLVPSVLRGGRRFTLFALNIGLFALASLWFVRAAISSSGLDSWASVAVGQTVGALGAIVVGYGWSIAGPTRVAALNREGQRQEYADATRVRLIILPVAITVVVVIVSLISSVDPLIAAVGSLPVLILALSANFYFVGTATPLRLLMLETVPRVAFTVIACILMSVFGWNVLSGLLIQLLGAIVAVACSAAFILGSSARSLYARGALDTRLSIKALLRRQRSGLLAALLVNFYAGAPILIVSVFAPAVLPAFSVVDKLAKQLLAGSSPVTAVLQGWVPRAGAGRLLARSRAAVAGAWALAAVVGAIVAVLSGPIVDWVSAGEYVPQMLTSTLIGTFVGLFLAQNAVSFSALAAQERLAIVNVSTAICAPIGLILVGLLTPIWGVDGALIGVCGGILGSLAWQSICAITWNPEAGVKAQRA